MASAGYLYNMDMDYIPMIYMIGFHNTPIIPMIDWLIVVGYITITQ